MDFNKIDIDSIKLEDSVKTSLDIVTNNGNMFYTPIMYMPFEIEEYRNNYSLNLQFRNIDSNPDLEDFLDFIQRLENKIKSLLKIDESEFTSQLRFNKKYDPILFTKFIFKFNKIDCNVIDDKDVPLNIFEIGKNHNVQVKLLLDKVWKFNGKYSYKLKIRELKILT
tara:strand:- start:9 stop:509 length:501 start_codon:yes stop_codon:yes gene_type:complete